MSLVSIGYMTVIPAGGIADVPRHPGARKARVGNRPVDLLDLRQRRSRGNISVKMKLTARRLPAVSIVSVAAVGPYEVTTQEAWEHLQNLLVKHGARALAKPVFALLRDMPHEVRAEERRLELCAQVNASSLKKLQGEATIQTFQGGAYLTMRHQGDYQKLPQMFSQMYAACSLDMNITLDTKRPRVILFNGDPAVVPPHDLVAELGMPVIDHSAEFPNRAG